MAGIVLADHMDLVTSGARSALVSTAEWQIVGEYHARSDLETALKVHQPDVVVCGDALDDALNVFKLVEVLRTASANTRIILLGSTNDGLMIGDLFDAGVRGYLYRADPLREHLAKAVTRVLLGSPYLSPTASTEYIIALHQGREWRLDAEARAVLELLAQGKHTGEIAAALHLSPRRVYKVRENLRRRFGATSNEHLITRAAAEGFTFPPD